MSELAIYTDGGCSGNPGPGGWGFVIIDEPAQIGTPARETIRSGGEPSTTNNRMELTAVIEALQTVLLSPQWRDRPVAVYTDSQYVQKGISEWIHGWKRNGWRTASKAPVKNRDLWEALDAAAGRLSLRWIWVKGHAGIAYNELCDELTQQEIARHRIS